MGKSPNVRRVFIKERLAAVFGSSENVCQLASCLLSHPFVRVRLCLLYTRDGGGEMTIGGVHVAMYTAMLALL